MMYLNAKLSVGDLTEGIKVRLGRVAFFAFSPLLILFLCASVSNAEVVNTKHNLGTYSPGTVKSTDTTQICVFCHTPHNSSPSGALWNRLDSGATYTVYGTNTMVSDLGQPTGASRLCLSCHDGTIALGSGSLINVSGRGLGGTITVTGAGTSGGKLTSASSTFIGTDLSNDHPISFDYNNSFPANIEISDILTLPAELKLDQSNNLQCTTCHDPHGTALDYFLTSALTNAGMCTACHLKRYWDADTPIHDTSTATWNSTAPNPWHIDLGAAGYTDDTPQLQSCLACHRSHGGANDMALAKGDDGGAPATELGEEWTCLSCHNGNVASVDMTPYFNQTVKVSEHPVMVDTLGGPMYNLHSASRDLPGNPVREAQTSLDNSNRHSECKDCHNPHGAKTGNHSVGSVYGFGIGNNLIGGWGVKPNADTWPLAGTAIDQFTGFTEIDFDTTAQPDLDIREGYMCMKCHSSYAYGTLDVDRPDVPSGNALGNTAIQSDIGLDLNPNNYGYHPVFAVGKNQPALAANPLWTAKGLTDTFFYTDWPGTPARAGFFNVEHDSTINCSDCHGSDVSTDLKGPHGSANKWILRGNETGVGTATNFCYNCHRRKVYGDEDFIPLAADAHLSRVDHPPGLSAASPFYQSTGLSGLATGNSSNNFGNLCLSCHGGFWDTTSTPGKIKGIHGSNAAAGVQAGSDPLGYRLMNGACVESYDRPETATDGTIWLSATLDDHCLYNFGTVTINRLTDMNYDCADVTDCNP